MQMAVFILGSAGFYAVAMVAMKFWGQGPQHIGFVLVPVIIALTVSAGVWLEISALKEERLGLIYVGILGAEVILIALASWALFGEQFTAKELAGGALIVVGTALAWV
ncbi:MAG: hypothetical protein AAF415_01670 [Pseudomonadota bacterium]